ncbi:hypothetical protein GOODEAATRI_017951 [Goodea atripinnis]|uniref:Scaffolding anchor of CK1 domain-containing protein n=1 Tax=Goodea atripinnis TaxID=208336 RepID=A0ABV0PPI6_9TELE
MDACNSMSVLFYRRSKPLGKVRRRVQNLRIPSSSYCDYAASGSKLDLSHNESARFAADSLLCQGLEGYHNMLKAEGEVDFLSELEKDYVLQNGIIANTDEAGEKDKMDIEFDCRSPFPSVLTNSVEYLDKKSHEDVKSAAPVSDDPSVEVFFQSDSSAAAMKDLIRQFLRKAKLALAIVMDSFSDPELLCDLLEASRKRNVSVHLLLDHLNLKVFVNVWQELKLISKNFPVEPLCDQPNLLSPPTSQQIQSKPSHQITFSSPREQMSKLQPNISFQETSKQDEFMKQYQGPLNSPFYAVPSCVKPTPPGIGTCLSPQRQADSKRFLSDVQTKMHFYPVTSQLNLTQRRHWSLQKATGPRVIGCYNSFSGTHVMGQAGWRPLLDSRNASLGRSLSMTERCTVDYRGAGLHPN